MLVTGGSTGLGAAMAAAFAAAGGRVAILARSRDKLERVAETTGAFPFAVDVGDGAAVNHAVAAAVNELGGLDGLVLNAGVMLHSAIAAGRAEDWEQSFRVNVLGTLNVVSTVLPHLRSAARADLVVIASVAADRVTPTSACMQRPRRLKCG